MPTGYTAPVMDGKVTDVKDFAADCARAFGAFIHQRDDSMSASLKYPEPPDDSYYVRALAEAKAELARWRSLNEEEKYAEWSDYVKQRTLSLHKATATSAEQRARYENMLIQVHAIDVPSMLQNFKDFMVEQLEESIKFDCGDGKFENDYYRVQSYSEWHDHKNERVLRDVVYYEKELTKEWDRYNERVKYIDTMADTFGFEVER